MARSKKPANWKILENVVGAIERSTNLVAGTRVIRNAMVRERVGGAPRQVDVCVEIATGSRTIRIGIEVSDKSRVLSLPSVEQLIAKLEKLDLDYRCIISRTGFAAEARAAAARDGVEMKTLAEVEVPGWWHARTMVFLERRIEVVSQEVVFKYEDLDRVVELMRGANANDLKLTMLDGSRGTLSELVCQEGMRAVDLPELSHLKDKNTFSLLIRFDDIPNATLSCPGGSLPLPDNILAHYRLHDNLEFVKVAAYRLSDGVDAFTGHSSRIGRQVTVVAKLHEAGARSFSVTLSDLDPPRTHLEPR